MNLTEDDAKKLGEILTVERTKRGLSLEQVRKKLESLNIIINRSDITRIENAKRKKPNALVLNGLCQIYNINFKELFGEIGYHLTEDTGLTLSEKNVRIYSSLVYAVKEDPNHVVEEIGKIKSTKNKVVGFKAEDNKMKNSFVKGDLIFLEKGLKVSDNKIGMFLIDGEYKIFKKKIISDKVALITDDNTPSILVEDPEEVGTIIGFYKEF